MPQGGAIELVGAQKIRNDLRLIMDRLETPEAVFEAEFSVLEQAEEIVFEGWSPDFVQTGVTKDSLTQRGADGAIRRILGSTLEFGTSIWYAKFQRRIAGASGSLEHPLGVGGEATDKPRGRRRTGRNLLLHFTPAARAHAAAIVREYILEGIGGGTAE